MSSEESLKKHVKKLSKLVQYKNKSEAELWDIARKKAELEDPDLQVDFLIDPEEKKRAKQLVAKYIEDYAIETVSDKNLVKQVIYLEIVQNRMQSQMNMLHKDEKAVPGGAVEILQKNLEAILKAKLALGITAKANQDSNTQPFALLKQKAKTWREENQGSRTLVCPHCSKMILLKIRAALWEALRHPFFRDRILTNDHLVKLFMDNKITKKDVSLIFGASEDYIDWLVKKWYNNQTMENPQNDGIQSQKTTEEISKEVKTNTNKN